MADENTEAQSSSKFEVGEEVVIREDFHSVYFRGLRATIAGPSRTGGTGETLWPLRLDVEPHEMVIAEKHLRRPADEPPVEEHESPAENGEPSRRSFLSRILPWKR